MTADRRSLDSTGLKRLHRSWRARTEGRVALILDDVVSPWNVGAIVRSAASYRVDEVWITGQTPDLDEPSVGKTALGCERYLDWVRCQNGSEAVHAAMEHNYTTVAIELAQGASPLHEVSLGPNTCLVLGHEDRGIRPATLDACDTIAYLPLLGRVGSLNVAAAAAISLYEVRRQTWTQNDCAP